MDPGSSPSWILGGHRPDEFLNFRGDFRSAGAMARKEAPVPLEPGTMPAHDRLRLYDQQDARPF